jgi:hypothetical protein
MPCPNSACGADATGYPRPPGDPGNHPGAKARRRHLRSGGAQVVVEAVADIGDLVGCMVADGDELAEKRDIGFGDAPVVGGGENIAGKVEFAEESKHGRTSG